MKEIKRIRDLSFESRTELFNTLNEVIEQFCFETNYLKDEKNTRNLFNLLSVHLAAYHRLWGTLEDFKPRAYAMMPNFPIEAGVVLLLIRDLEKRNNDD